MTMTVTVIDSVEVELVKVEFKDDHFFELARRKVIFYRPKRIHGTVYQIPTMKHTDLIDSINEMAL